MAWKPPTKDLRKRELLGDERFYRELSAKCNFASDEATTDWYLGLVKMISQELRENKFVRLPHLGDMALVTQKSRPALCGKARVLLGPTEVLRFYPKQKMKRYFAKRKISTI